MYLHESAHLVPGLLSKCITQLNDDTFHESIGDEKKGTTAVGSELAKLASAKKRKLLAAKKKSAGETVATAILAISDNAKARNKSQKYAFLIGSKKTVIDTIAECRKEKRKALVQGAEDRGCSLSEMKEGLADYKKKREGTEVEQRLLSQDSVFEVAMEFDADIVASNEEKGTIRLKLDKAREEDKENNIANGSD